MLGTSSDLLHREIHEESTQKLITAFASDKSQRALLLAKVRKGK